MGMTLTDGLTRRERARATTIAEIKQTAMDLMREQGTPDIRFADIARAMGMTAPALYRYYADRDKLLTDLVTDAFGMLAEAVSQAREQIPARDIEGRWLAVASAYRDWARQEPERFSL